MFSGAHPFATGGGGDSFEYMVATLLAVDLILSRRDVDGSVITVIETQTGPEGFEDLQLTLEMLDGGCQTVHVQCRHRQRFAKSDARFPTLLKQAAAAVASDEMAFATEQRRLAIVLDRNSPGNSSMKQLCELARTSGSFRRFVEVVERHGGEVRRRWGFCCDAAGDMEDELLHSVLRSLEVRLVELTSEKAPDYRDMVNRLADAWSPRDHRRAESLVNALFRLLKEMGQVAGIVDMGFLEARLGSQLPTTLGAETRRERLRRRRAAGHRRVLRRLTAIGVDIDEAEVLAQQLLDTPPNITNSEPITVITGLMGVGKSTELERLHRAAVDEALRNPNAPIPIRVEAAEIGSDSLRGALSTHVDGLGDPSRVGVHLVIDGLDEAGMQVDALIGRIETMQAAWRNSTVLLGTRPQQLAPDLEEVRVKPLTHEDAESLIGTLGTDIRHLDWFREEIGEVLCRPLLAIRFALDRRSGRSVGINEEQLVASVGEHALRDLGDTADEDSQLLVQLACQIVDSGGRLVAPRDLDASATRIAQLSRLRIVQNINGKLCFQLAALTEYFAADALRRDPEMLVRSVSSPLSAHRWRYVFVQTLRQGSAEQIDTIMTTLLAHAPATASWVQNEAYTPQSSRDSAPPVASAEHAGTRIRRAAESWLEPWPGLVELCGEDGKLPPLGVALTNSWLKTAWLFGTDATAEPVALIPPDEMEYGKALRYGRTDSPLAGITGRGLSTGEDWPWVWVRGEFQEIIENHLQNRRLLADIKLCWPELAWDFAHQMLGRDATTGSEPVFRSELEAVVASHQSPRSSGTFAFGFSSDWSVSEGDAFIADLTRIGLEEITSPWPAADLSGNTVEACWTNEQLLLRLRAATGSALDIYQQIVDRHLPSMASQLHTYQLLPGRVRGSLMPIGADWRYPDAPFFSWHIEPMPNGSANGAKWELKESDGWIAEDEWAYRADRMRELRGDLVERVSFWERASQPGIFSSAPASSLALQLLWNDLAEYGWVTRPYNEPFFSSSVRPRYT